MFFPCIFQYTGSFTVVGHDQASRTEYVRTQLKQMRVSTVSFVLEEGEGKKNGKDERKEEKKRIIIL